ncbi:MAG: hypothetical protein VST71_10485 [Nitrospirota bacterium]|nr:hypothetical protein [Nitrospirota bacterium]
MLNQVQHDSDGAVMPDGALCSVTLKLFQGLKRGRKGEMLNQVQHDSDGSVYTGWSFVFCHPELVSGSQKRLQQRDAESSSA